MNHGLFKLCLLVNAIAGILVGFAILMTSADDRAMCISGAAFFIHLLQILLAEAVIAAIKDKQ